MQVLGKVSDAVLTLSVPNENAISINTRGLSMTLGRHSPDKLVGLEIKGGDGRFILPSHSQSLLPRRGFVDTQVRTQFNRIFDSCGAFGPNSQLSCSPCTISVEFYLAHTLI